MTATSELSFIAPRACAVAVALSFITLGATADLRAQGQPLVSPDAICMSKQPQAEAPLVAIVLPSSNAEAMRGVGFEEAPCEELFNSQAEMRAWRDETCEFASNQDARLQEVIESRLGAHPAVLCGMAEVVVGQWQQPLQSGN